MQQVLCQNHKNFKRICKVDWDRWKDEDELKARNETLMRTCSLRLARGVACHCVRLARPCCGLLLTPSALDL
jgi:hypothetical protein